jgi:hypothetical protein
VSLTLGQQQESYEVPRGNYAVPPDLNSMGNSRAVVTSPGRLSSVTDWRFKRPHKISIAHVILFQPCAQIELDRFIEDFNGLFVDTNAIVQSGVELA